MNRHLVYIAEEPNWKNIHPLNSSINYRLYQVVAKSYTSTACLVFSKILYPHLSIKILWHSQYKGVARQQCKSAQMRILVLLKKKYIWKLT